MTKASVFTDEISQDFAEAARTAAEAGLHYVDIRNAWQRSCSELGPGDWHRIAEILRDHGLQLGVIQSPFGKCDLADDAYQQHLAFLPRLIEEAHRFGTDVIRIFPFWQTDLTLTRVRPNFGARLPEIASKLRQASRLAEADGVFLALEPEHSTFGGSPTEIRAIIEAVGSPALKVAWDVSNGWLPDEPIFPDGYEKLRGLIVNVHVKDRAFAPGDEADRRLPALLGTGVVPWPRVIQTLKADGYSGLYSIETHFGSRGPYGWQKLKAATTYYMYALRELLEANG